MEKFELHNKIIQQLRFHRISGLDEEKCADNILSLVQTDWTEGCSCYHGDTTGETWCCNKCGKPTNRHASPPTTLPSDLVAEITKLQEQWDENGVSLPYHIQLSRVNSCINLLFKDQLAKIAEMEREMKEAKQFISDVMNFADGIKVLDGEALKILKKTARRVLSDTPTKLPRK